MNRNPERSEVIRVPPTPRLREWSEAHGFSPELVARWGEFYPDLLALLKALQSEPRVFVRLNPLRGDPERTAHRLRQKGFVLQSTPLPGVFDVQEQPFSIGATEEYLLGQYYIQDASSVVAPLALGARPGERVGDLCAAPGGKAIVLADLMQNHGALYCFDEDPGRVRALESNLARCGVRCAAVHAGPGEDAAQLGLAFDRLLIDAPCTGEGVVQRDPTRRRGHLGEYAACAARQASLLDAAHGLLRPGGTLVYSTCTLAPEENELQLQRLLDSGRFDLEPLPPAVARLRLGANALHPGLTRVAGRDLDPRLSRAAHLLPHLHGTLGFFVARLRRGNP